MLYEINYINENNESLYATTEADSLEDALKLAREMGFSHIIHIWEIGEIDLDNYLEFEDEEE